MSGAETAWASLSKTSPSAAGDSGKVTLSMVPSISSGYLVLPEFPNLFLKAFWSWVLSSLSTGLPTRLTLCRPSYVESLLDLWGQMRVTQALQRSSLVCRLRPVPSRCKSRGLCTLPSDPKTPKSHPTPFLCYISSGSTQNILGMSLSSISFSITILRTHTHTHTHTLHPISVLKQIDTHASAHLRRRTLIKY